MFFQRFYSKSIAQASFLVGCAANGEAIVVDPTRDVDQYLKTAEKEGFRIVAITETHIHADYVSGSRELASITGAQLYLSKEGGPDWQYAYSDQPNVTLIGDGDEIEVGNVRLRASHTPGHTPEHLSFYLIDGAATTEPIGIFTGDFVFAGDVGRPDLLEVAAGFKDTMRKGAQVLFHSVQEFKKQPSWLTIWPGHGAGSACGKKLGGVPSTTLGYEKIVNTAVRYEDETEFVEDILAGQPEPPKYFARMKSVNKLGPNFTRGQWRISQVEPVGQIVDVRSILEYQEGSISNAISIPMNASFSMWAGSLLSLEEPITIVANDEQQAQAAAKAMFLIGIENIAGWSLPTTTETIPLGDLQMLEGGLLLDVRTAAEHDADAIEGSIHVPLAYLADEHSWPTGKIYVHCASGQRAMVAASFLRRKGIDAVPLVARYEDVKKAWSSRMVGQGI